jgi:hypothetical protein
MGWKTFLRARVESGGRVAWWRGGSDGHRLSSEKCELDYAYTGKKLQKRARITYNGELNQAFDFKRLGNR